MCEYQPVLLNLVGVFLQFLVVVGTLIVVQYCRLIRLQAFWVFEQSMRRQAQAPFRAEVLLLIVNSLSNIIPLFSFNKFIFSVIM